MISKANEEYLKTMYILYKQNGNIRVTDVANKMNCTKPSVNKALNNLKENKLVNYETYGTIELTKEGEDLAKKIIEAYDIVFFFFFYVLEINEEKTKKKKKKMKSALNDNTLNKLARYVHSVLDLGDLNCSYDLNNERCRSCIRKISNKKKDNK